MIVVMREGLWRFDSWCFGAVTRSVHHLTHKQALGCALSASMKFPVLRSCPTNPSSLAISAVRLMLMSYPILCHHARVFRRGPNATCPYPPPGARFTADGEQNQQRRAHGPDRRRAASNPWSRRQPPPTTRCPCPSPSASIKLLSREGGSRRAGKSGGWTNRRAQRREAQHLGQWERGEGREGGQWGRAARGRQARRPERRAGEGASRVCHGLPSPPASSSPPRWRLLISPRRVLTPRQPPGAPSPQCPWGEPPPGEGCLRPDVTSPGQRGGSLVGALAGLPAAFLGLLGSFCRCARKITCVKTAGRALYVRGVVSSSGLVCAGLQCKAQL